VLACPVQDVVRDHCGDNADRLLLAYGPGQQLFAHSLEVVPRSAVSESEASSLPFVLKQLQQLVVGEIGLPLGYANNLGMKVAHLHLETTPIVNASWRPGDSHAGGLPMVPDAQLPGESPVA
jgi:hypothetical protein